MYRLFIFLLILSTQSYAITGSDIIATAEQFQNRNWHFQAAQLARRAHLTDYTNTGLISRVQDILLDFTDVLSINNSAYDFSLFFPEASLNSQSDRIEMRENFLKKADNYRTLSNWHIFLTAVAKEKWLDEVGCSPSDLQDARCGRRTAGDFAIRNLTYNQRQSLQSFKDIVIDDLNFIRHDTLSIPVGPGLARVLQFLVDQRSVYALIQVPYIQMNDANDPDLRKKNIIEIGRALLIQVFQTSNSPLITNIYGEEIVLEDTDCLEKNFKNEVDCQLEYVRNLVWDKSLSESSQMTNLLLDPKGIKPFSEALISHFKNRPDFEYEDLKVFLKEAYLALCIAYDYDPTLLNSEVNEEFRDLFMKQLQDTMEYLINKRDIVGLHMARGLQELVLFLKGLPYEI